MSTYAKHLSRNVPQSEAIPGQEMVKNDAGGYVFAVDDWTRLERFLILGSCGGTYYATERKLTLDNAAVVKRCMDADGAKTVQMIINVSMQGRAPKNEPALMALAIVAKTSTDETTRKIALMALPMVARIGTHLFQFAEYVKQLGGWGKGTRRAVANWYTAMDPDRLALQVIKYQGREGWTHRDVMRKAHPKTDVVVTNAILNWAAKGWESVGPQPHPDRVLSRIWAFERAKRTTSHKELERLITEYQLPHECVPNEAKSNPAIWEAMLPAMGMTALIRNLGKMSSVGLLKSLSSSAKYVAKRLADEDQLRAGRIHPMTMLVAQKVYISGHGDKGSLTWRPVNTIIDALDAGFYAAFKAVEPTGKRHLLALDVSRSMELTPIAGMSSVNARVASAAMAMVTANVEPDYAVMAFTHGPENTLYGPHTGGITPFPMSARQRLDDVCAKINQLTAGGTDCALPMVWAAKNDIPVDVFVVYTDNETWAGNIHPSRALERYRQKMGIAAKLVVVGMAATEFSIADPKDAGQLDVVGFDSAAPAFMADFARR